MRSTAEGRRRVRFATVLLLIAPVLLAGCGAEAVWAPDAEVQQAIYRADGPPTITLYTMINNRSKEGAHSGLMVSGSQRVVFDPAGSFHHPQLPERNDVFFGMTPAAKAFYIDYHARETFHVVEQTLVVTPEQAEAALVAVQKAGPVPKAACSNAIGKVLRQVPGFEDFGGGLFPAKTMRDFGRIPGVETRKYFDDSPDRRGDLITVPKVR